MNCSCVTKRLGVHVLLASTLSYTLQSMHMGGYLDLLALGIAANRPSHRPSHKDMKLRKGICFREGAAAVYLWF